MPGPRPGGGRPSKYVYNIGNTTYYSLDEAALAEGVSKMTITRWCRGGKEGCSREDAEKAISGAIEKSMGEISGYSKKAKTEPLDLWLYILDHPDEFNEKIRMQAAYYAAPYRHPKATTSLGKKGEKQQKAQQASGGRFRPSEPPKLKVAK